MRHRHQLERHRLAGRARRTSPRAGDRTAAPSRPRPRRAGTNGAIALRFRVVMASSAERTGGCARTRPGRRPASPAGRPAVPSTARRTRSRWRDRARRCVPPSCGTAAAPGRCARRAGRERRRQRVAVGVRAVEVGRRVLAVSIVVLLVVFTMGSAVLGAPPRLTHAVVALEREAERVDRRVAAGAAGVARVLLEASARGHRRIGRREADDDAQRAGVPHGKHATRRINETPRNTGWLPLLVANTDRNAAWFRMPRRPAPASDVRLPAPPRSRRRRTPAPDRRSSSRRRAAH